ncbi:MULTISPECIES: hypothetical protein [unclassified Nonomuraea]|uniref:hypothetical protein n=1 Tax=unclassified Nonomuraea TaxID=2593643 RepID=UPI0035C2290B
MSELPEETGDERVDAIVAGLAGLGELPVSAHVAVFDEAFSGLESTLAAVDEAPAGEQGGGQGVGHGGVQGVGGQGPGWQGGGWQGGGEQAAGHR